MTHLYCLALGALIGAAVALNAVRHLDAELEAFFAAGDGALYVLEDAA